MAVRLRRWRLDQRPRGCRPRPRASNQRLKLATLRPEHVERLAVEHARAVHIHKVVEAIFECTSHDVRPVAAFIAPNQRDHARHVVVVEKHLPAREHVADNFHERWAE
eukprot:1436241-Pyramimonas_sp.AAC.1